MESVAFELLQKPAGTLELLMHLHRHGKAAPVAVMSDTGMSRDAFYNAKERLRSLGFLYEDRETGYPKYVYVGLTRAGEEVAKALVPAGDLLSGTATALEAELEGLERANDATSLARRVEILALLADRDTALGRWDAAEGSARRLVEVARLAKDDRGEAAGRLALSRVLQKRDRHDAAADELGEARRAAEAAHAPALGSEVEYLLGSNLERQGRWTEALERFAASAEKAREAEDAVPAARARQATARVLARRGRLAESLAILREVAAELESLGARAEDDLPRVYVAWAARRTR